ncbi:MAG: hypothetical protein ABIK33_02630 [candidate division WOR-3 bacterium]
MNQNQTEQSNNIEIANPEHLIKEYEMCWNGVEHHNTRLWSSASIFISGSILALSWLSSRTLSKNDWNEFSLVAIVALTICVVLYFYLRIFSAWELMVRVEFYRAREIEKSLGLWRIRYRRLISVSDFPMNNDKIKTLRDEIKKEMGIEIDKLAKRRANPYFRRVIYIVITALLLLVLRALIITLDIRI